jgi:hypothetical protein
MAQTRRRNRGAKKPCSETSRVQGISGCGAPRNMFWRFVEGFGGCGLRFIFALHLVQGDKFSPVTSYS